MEYKKSIRLTQYDYNTPGYYFITICTFEKQSIFCTITPKGSSADISYQLTPVGRIIQKYLDEMSDFYSYAKIDKHVIMPNHIHFILQITEEATHSGKTNNNIVSSFVGTLKRFCNKSCGSNIWQARFYDHVIRNETDYLNTWNYIDGNPYKWVDDDYYCR